LKIARKKEGAALTIEERTLERQCDPEYNETVKDIIEDYDAVISLCGCGVNLPEAWVVREVFENWQLNDPDGQALETFHRVRDEIKQRVAQLVIQLSE
jgi:protein-tyrosine-phosphatase